MERGDVSKWLTFDPAAWPGECIAEKFAAWRAAGKEAYASDRSLDGLEIIKAQYSARAVMMDHVDCVAHPPVEEWPEGWARDCGVVRFTVARWDGARSTEVVEVGSDRDVELMDACRRRAGASRAVKWFTAGSAVASSG